MKYIYILIALIIFDATNLMAQCSNGGVETGDFTNWEGAYGSNHNGRVWFNSLTYGWSNTGSNPRHSIVTQGPDPIVSALNRVGNDNYSIRLGNSETGGKADLVKYTLTVTNANKDFGFRYAMVMQSPGHTPKNQPFFSYIIYKGTSWTDWQDGLFNNNIIAEKKFLADPSNPFFNTTTQGIVWRDWTSECVDLSAYVGQQVSIIFTAADCDYVNHYGYAYIDGLCGNNESVANLNIPSPVCLNQPLIADASASINEESHFWSVQESDASWNRYGTEYMQWYVGQPAGTLDVNQFVQSQGGQLKCNTYYRVKIAVSSGCTPWAETTKLVYVKCAEVDAGLDQCCSGGTINIGGKISADIVSYSWKPITGLSSPNTPLPSVNCSALTGPGPWEYTLTATDKKGCTGSDKVRIFKTPPSVSIAPASGCCSRSLTAVVSGGYTSIKWSTGESTESIIADNTGTYSVTVTNPCGAATASHNVLYSLDRYYTSINENSDHYYSTKSNQETNSGNFEIIHVEDPEPPYGEYFATAYKLEIYNRWGELFHIVEDDISSCQGFPNHSIMWDGNVNGQTIPGDEYVGKLYIKNCGTDWTLVKVNYCEKMTWECKTSDCVFAPFNFECGFFKAKICIEGTYYCSDQRKEFAFPIIIVR